LVEAKPSFSTYGLPGQAPGRPKSSPPQSHFTSSLHPTPMIFTGVARPLFSVSHIARPGSPTESVFSTTSTSTSVSRQSRLAPKIPRQTSPFSSTFLSNSEPWGSITRSGPSSKVSGLTRRVSQSGTASGSSVTASNSSLIDTGRHHKRNPSVSVSS